MSAKEMLLKRRILVVEDDDACARRVKREFEYCGSRISIKHTVEAGLRELDENGLTYDLIIVDVMLPATEADFRKINGIKRRLDDCYQVLQKEGEDSADGEESERVEKAREKRHYLLELVHPLIRPNGGIEMVKKWIDSLDESKAPPILYLSGRTDISDKHNGIEAARGGSVAWLTKPVAGRDLIDKAGALIMETRIG